MRRLFILFFVLVGFSAFSQVPVIQQFEPTNTFPNDTITISGTGFDANPANLEVWFDAVKGQIISSTIYNIRVVVPVQAKASNIEVINKSSKLSGKSILKFIPSYVGANFDVTKFGGLKSFTAPEELWDLCTCDFDKDGKPDITATKTFRANQNFQPGQDIMVLQNTSVPGTLNFNKLDKTNLTSLQLLAETDNVVCGDLNGDALPDLVLTRTGQKTVYILKNISSGPNNINFASKVEIALKDGFNTQRLVIRDLNRDGKPEIIVTNSNAASQDFGILLNQTPTNGSFSFTSSYYSVKVNPDDANLETYDIDVQDYNNDGLADIVVNQFQSQDLYFLRNESKGSIDFAPAQKIVLSGNFQRLASADFNNDGLLDIVVTNTILNRADVLINNTTSTTFSFNASIAINTSLEPWGVEVADINGDHNVDIIIANKNTNPINTSQLKINAFLNNGAAIPAFSRNDITTTVPTRNLKVNDFDGDGKPDIAFTGFNESTVTSQVGIIRNGNCHQATILNEENTFCNPRSVKLQAIPANNVTFSWQKDGGAPIGTDAFLSITAGGVYKVTVTGEGGTCITSDDITMTKNTGSAPTLPTITSGDKACAGQSFQLTTPTIAGAEYIWTGPNGFSSTTQNPTIATVSIENAGVYTLQVKSTSDGCLSDVQEKIIGIADLSDFTISSSVAGTLCAGSTTNLIVNNVVDHTYQWRKNGADIATATSPIYNVTEDGSYTVFITNTSIPGCAAETEPKDVVILSAPSANFTAPTFCDDIENTFTNTSTVDSRATVVYTWTFGDASSSNDVNPAHTYANAGNFTVNLNVQYSGVSGCNNAKSQPLTVLAPQAFTILGEADVCPDGETELSVPAGFTVVAWGTSETTPTIMASNGDYNVTATDPNGCTIQSFKTIGLRPLPVISASSRRSTINAGDTTLLEATGGASYLWSPNTALAEIAMETSASPIAKPAETITFTVTGTGENGCINTAEVTVTVTPSSSMFPMAFSPNGDGQNEEWVIQKGGNADCMMTIFDGRGRRIFEKKGENWNGTYNGSPVPDGTYYYVYGCPSEKPVTGTVLVFR